MKWTLILLLPFLPLHSDDALSPKETEEEVRLWNEELTALKEELKQKYKAASLLKDASEEEHQALLEEINKLKRMLSEREEAFRTRFKEELKEEYALWDQGETTISELIMEYGSSDFLFVIPQELSALKLSLHSSIALPRESWPEMIDLILKSNGIGTKRLNPFAKQLYILKHDLSSIELIADKKEDLKKVDGTSRVFFVISPEPEQSRPLQSFFERFSDPKETTVHVVSGKVILVTSRESVEKLLSLYSAVWEQGGGKVIRVINLKKIQGLEAEKILKAFFHDSVSKLRPSFYPQIGDEIVIMTLPGGLVLVGEQAALDRAEKVIQDLENQMEDPSELTVFWYTCKHSDPSDLAEVLEKIYDSLVHSDVPLKMAEEILPPPPFMDRQPGPPTPMNPPLSQLATAPKAKSLTGNFIVDPKTGCLLMVVRKEELSKIKALLKKLDVPKKMVQIDVLLVERKIQDRKQSGINLLKIGSGAGKKHDNGISFDASQRSPRKGIFDFILSIPKSSLPAIDLTYSFLLAQDDVRINANPSVIAVNQTPATISIVEEISINNGASLVDRPGGVQVEKSFTRASYGTTLVMTPTIHLPDVEEENESSGFITLVTNITFDTTETSQDDRPPVTRRHIENEVRVADGETIILGGLKRKSAENKQEKIPFLGDIPGIGKLFGTNAESESNTEMFIFITPHIIKNPVEHLRQIRTAELQKRPGDIPEFIARLEEAKTYEKKRMFEDSLDLIFHKQGIK